MLKLILLVIFACLTFQATCTETYENSSYADVYYIGSSHTSDVNSDEDCNNKCTKPNEIYEICPAKCPFRTCGIDDTLIDCAPSPRPGDPDCPKPACRCKNQYFRDDKGDCVRWNQCPKCTNPNEIYDPCDAPCPARRCDFDSTVVRCAAPPQVGDDNCVVGCRCIDGYLNDDNGVCVPKDQCPKCTNPNEIYDPCDAPCPARRCDFDSTVVRCAAPPQVGDDNCVVGCRCIDGYLKDDNGVCVPKDKCPKCTNPNEIYDPCDAPCPARRCDFDSTVVRCAAPPQVGDDNCVVGCRCIDGYLKDDNGVCVPKDQCPKCTNPNEIYDPCDAPCPARRCDFDSTVVRCAAPPQVGDDNCVVGCRCIDGYLKDDNGVCVPKDQCHKCKLPNEVYDSCPDNSPQTCETMNDTYEPTIRSIAKCKPACRCKPGTFRNKIGQCIAGEDCLKCQQPHEYFTCGGACDNVCETLSQQNQTNCLIINKTCNKMCYCEEGYARNKNKTCVPFKDCPIPPPTCLENEELSTCVQALCRAQNCADKDKPVACPIIAEGSCITGCVCKQNYLKAKNGTCIPEDQCENLACTKPHEVLDSCIQAGCGPRNCSQLGKPIACPRIDPRYCKEGCVCEEGYVWDETGRCIKKTKCPSCGDDPNAISGCGMFCSKQCSNYNSSKPVDCPNDLCGLNGCVCRKNYVYDDKIGKCVLPKQCTPVCKEHEVYDECINGGCDARNCSQLGYPVPCVKLDPDSCIKGCVCENGFLRAKNGTCIPKKECPSCGGDPNAESGCGTNCGKRCSTYKDKPVICPRILCQLNGCDCKPGYVYDDNIKKCVKPEKCTPVCKEHEVYDECINGGCDARNCSQLGYPVPCVKLDPDSCIKGCVCENGFLRAKNGTCIPKTECPSCGGDPNAESGCGTNCGKRCSTYKNNKAICPLICEINGCDCKPGYVYDDNKKKCVKPEKCTPVCKKKKTN